MGYEEGVAALIKNLLNVSCIPCHGYYHGRMANEETLSKEEIIRLIEEGDRYAGVKFEEIKGYVNAIMETYDAVNLKVGRVEAKLYEFQRDTSFKFDMLFTGQKELREGQKQLFEGHEQFAEGQKQLFDGHKQLAEGQKRIFAGQEKLVVGRKQLFEELRAMRKEFSEGFNTLEARIMNFQKGSP